MSNEISGNQPNSMSEKRPNKLVAFFTWPVALIRTSSVLSVLLVMGHMWGCPWTSDQVLQEKQLVRSMRSTDFVFLGEHTTYWNLYFGFGIWLAVFLIAMAFILWVLSNIARLVPRPVGIISGIFAATCLIGACISFRYFYTPPFITLSVMCVILLMATVQLLRKA
jgi:hypothetical protein